MERCRGGGGEVERWRGRPNYPLLLLMAAHQSTQATTKWEVRSLTNSRLDLYFGLGWTCADKLNTKFLIKPFIIYHKPGAKDRTFRLKALSATKHLWVMSQQQATIAIEAETKQCSPF